METINRLFHNIDEDDNKEFKKNFQRRLSIFLNYCFQKLMSLVLSIIEFMIEILTGSVNFEQELKKQNYERRRQKREEISLQKRFVEDNELDEYDTPSNIKKKEYTEEIPPIAQIAWVKIQSSTLKFGDNEVKIENVRVQNERGLKLEVKTKITGNETSITILPIHVAELTGQTYKLLNQYLVYACDREISFPKNSEDSNATKQMVILTRTGADVLRVGNVLVTIRRMRNNTSKALLRLSMPSLISGSLMVDDNEMFIVYELYKLQDGTYLYSAAAVENYEAINKDE